MKNKLLYLGILPILCGFASCSSLGTFFSDDSGELESSFQFEDDLGGFDTKLPNQSNSVGNRAAPIEVPNYPVDGGYEDEGLNDEEPNQPSEEQGEIEYKDIDLSLNKETVELDFGGNRTHNAVSNSLTGQTASCFDASETITASYSLEGTGYKSHQVRVEWSIPVDDATYFSLSEDGASVTVTALLPSRLSTLTAQIIKVADGSVINEATCELRSVMVNTYWIGNQNRATNTLGGCDITDYATGYTARFYNTTYSKDEDIVFPSKLKVDGVTKMVTRIVGLAKADGSAGISGSYMPKCRNIYIPNTVTMLSSKALCYIEPTNAPIFQDGGCNYLFLDLGSLGTRAAVGTNYFTFVNKINLEDGSFPYTKYASGVAEEATAAPSFESLTAISTIKNLNSENIEGANKKVVLSKN